MMRRLFSPILLVCLVWLACPLSGQTGPGSQTSNLLANPEAGLDSLDNYSVTLKVSFKGTLSGLSADSSDTYRQSAWPAQSAVFTTIESTGGSAQDQFILAGSVGEAQYYQAAADAPCTVQWGAQAGGPSHFQPASLLPAVGTARLAGEETVSGIATNHSTFDAASLDLPDGTTATGEAWIAKSGGYLVKYTLDITGADSLFGDGGQGTRHIEYLLTEVNSRPEVVYSAGCQPVLTDMPMMDGAGAITRLPGILDYSTDASIEDIHAFYVAQLTPQGWEELTVPAEAADPAMWTFTQADTGLAAIIIAESDGDTRWVTVMLAGEKAEGSSTTTPGTTPGPTPKTAGSNSPSVRVSMALGILVGMIPQSPPPPSFHLEAVNQVPVASGSSIALKKDVMSADVQGKDVHFIHRVTPPGGSTKTTEVYLIGGQEYDVLNGTVQPPGASLMGLDWTTWPLDLTVMLATSSTSAKAAGTEVLDGRTVEVYELNATSDSQSGVPGAGLLASAVSGKVWVDQETGALLKAILDYQTDVNGTAGNSLGSGSGHAEIIVTQIGQVTVSLPGK